MRPQGNFGLNLRLRDHLTKAARSGMKLFVDHASQL